MMLAGEWRKPTEDANLSGIPVRVRTVIGRNSGETLLRAPKEQVGEIQ